MRRALEEAFSTGYISEPGDETRGGRFYLTDRGTPYDRQWDTLTPAQQREAVLAGFNNREISISPENLREFFVDPAFAERMDPLAEDVYGTMAETRRGQGLRMGQAGTRAGVSGALQARGRQRSRGGPEGLAAAQAYNQAYNKAGEAINEDISIAQPFQQEALRQQETEASRRIQTDAASGLVQSVMGAAGGLFGLAAGAGAGAAGGGDASGQAASAGGDAFSGTVNPLIGAAFDKVNADRLARTNRNIAALGTATAQRPMVKMKASQPGMGGGMQGALASSYAGGGSSGARIPTAEERRKWLYGLGA